MAQRPRRQGGGPLGRAGGWFSYNSQIRANLKQAASGKFGRRKIFLKNFAALPLCRASPFLLLSPSLFDELLPCAAPVIFTPPFVFTPLLLRRALPLQGPGFGAPRPGRPPFLKGGRFMALNFDPSGLFASLRASPPGLCLRGFPSGLLAPSPGSCPRFRGGALRGPPGFP